MGIKKEQTRKVDNVNIQVERLWEDKPPPPRTLFIFSRISHALFSSLSFIQGVTRRGIL
jgi:hypothetical protein